MATNSIDRLIDPALIQPQQNGLAPTDNNARLRKDPNSSRKRPSQEAHGRQSKRLRPKRILGMAKYRKEVDGMTRDASNKYCDNVTALKDTQIGLTLWTGKEREQLYMNLSRYGKHDLPRLISNLPDKSEAEAKVYIDLFEECVQRHDAVKSSDAHYHGYRPDRNPPAFEISEELTAKLDHSARLLATNAYMYELVEQKRYFGVCGSLTRQLAWDLEVLLGKEDAAIQQQSVQEKQEKVQGQAADVAIDSGKSQNENEQQGKRPCFTPLNYPGLELPTHPTLLKALRFLDLDAFLSLSQIIFMNKGSPHEDENWASLHLINLKHCQLQLLPNRSTNVVPFMFASAFIEFYHIAICLIKRLVHAAVFQALSRLRTNDNGFPETTVFPKVRHSDAIAAINVLGLKQSRQRHDYWITKAREYSLEVYDVKFHESDWPMRWRLLKAQKMDIQPLSYDEVEWRLRRPRNINSTIVNQDDPSFAIPHQRLSLLSQQEHASLRPLGTSTVAISRDPQAFPSVYVEATNGESAVESEALPGPSSDELKALPTSERAQWNAIAKINEYHEFYDQYVSAKDEKFLWSIAPGGLAPDVAARLDATPKPPMWMSYSPYKIKESYSTTIDDVCDFREEWERYGKFLPEKAFEKSKREWLKRKRERLDQLTSGDDALSSDTAPPAVSEAIVASSDDDDDDDDDDGDDEDGDDEDDDDKNDSSEDASGSEDERLAVDEELNVDMDSSSEDNGDEEDSDMEAEEHEGIDQANLETTNEEAAALAFAEEDYGFEDDSEGGEEGAED